MHWILFYDVVDDYLERRPAFRAEHLAHARAANERGELLFAGALAEPPDGAVFAFGSESPDVVEAFARADPYVVNGLVRSWRVRRWVMVIGEGAEAV